MEADTVKYYWNRLLVARAREGMTENQRKSLADAILSDSPNDELRAAAMALGGGKLTDKMAVDGFQKYGAQGFDVAEYRNVRSVPNNDEPSIETRMDALLRASHG